ncbi:MAG: SHOCT domain-containing protein [Alkalispirochaeta sp.]
MKNRTLLVAVLLTAVVFGAFAQVDGHNRSVEDVEAEIRTTLGLSSEERINPDAVSEELLIALGDAVMGVYVGDPERHEWMDEMMGGEGSSSLDNAHRWMAYRYLSGGYAGGQNGMGYGMTGGMMGAGMMGGGWGLMGNPDMMYEGIPYGSPEEVLKRRYAAGEISRREFRRMLREIE